MFNLQSSSLTRSSAKLLRTLHKLSGPMAWCFSALALLAVFLSPFFVVAVAAAKSLQSAIWLCETPEMAAHQAPRSLGFSRQEHWSGLPFPFPMHEGEKWKRSRSVVSDSATPWTAAYQAPPSMGFSRQEYWSGLPLPSPFLLLLTINLFSCSFIYFHNFELAHPLYIYFY